VVQLAAGAEGALLVAALDRGLGPGYDLHVLAEGLPALEAALAMAGAELLPAVELERRRVLAGLPGAHADGFTGLLPQECGLEEAVSYRKGCYVGQEIMARLEARGHTNRHLVRALSRAPLERGARLALDGREVGLLGSSRRGAGRLDGSGGRSQGPTRGRESRGGGRPRPAGLPLSAELAGPSSAYSERVEPGLFPLC
jgi:folate-binding protein YgfZ